MEKTVTDHLVDALDDLGSDNLKRFKSKLCDRPDEPRVRRGAVEKAVDTVELAELLVRTLTVERAVPVTVQILTAISCNQQARDLTAAGLGSPVQLGVSPALQPTSVNPSFPPFDEPDTISTPVPAQFNVPSAPQPAAGNASLSSDMPDTSSPLIPCSMPHKEAVLRENGEEIYTVLDKGERKRLALLINNVEFDCKGMKRNGAQIDEKNMEWLLRALGYDVVKYTNLSAQEMEEAVKNFADRREHAESDSTFVVIMSHGGRDGILGVHHGIFKVDKIYFYLNTAKCPALRDKPKVILIQACRGGEDGKVWVADAASDDFCSFFASDAWENEEKNFASLMSCTPGTKSYRHPQKGSLFIGFVVEVFNANAHRDHIEELFRQVMRRFEKFQMVKQMVCKDRTTLIKKFYLFPGH